MSSKNIFWLSLLWTLCKQRYYRHALELILLGTHIISPGSYKFLSLSELHSRKFITTVIQTFKVTRNCFGSSLLAFCCGEMFIFFLSFSLRLSRECEKFLPWFTYKVVQFFHSYIRETLALLTHILVKNRVMLF